MPIERAVPAIVRIAASRLVVLRSGIFMVAMSLSCFCEIFPTLTLLGSLEPEPGFLAVASPAAFLMRMGAGGVFPPKPGYIEEVAQICAGDTTEIQHAQQQRSLI